MKERKSKSPVNNLIISPQGIRVGVSAIIFNSQGKILLCQRRDLGWWTFPGGGVEARESLEKAVLREVEEETGLKIVLERISGIYLKTKEKTVVFVFRGKPKVEKKIIKESRETKDVKWCSLKEAEVLLSPNLRQRLQDAISQNQTIYIRRQDTLPFKLWLDLKKRDLKKLLKL